MQNWIKCYPRERKAMLSNIYFIMNMKLRIIIIFILSTNNNCVGGSVNTVQSEVSVGSKYWILSGLTVSQFSSKNFKTVLCALLMFINIQINRLYKEKKVFIAITEKYEYGFFIHTSFSFYAR